MKNQIQSMPIMTGVYTRQGTLDNGCESITWPVPKRGLLHGNARSSECVQAMEPTKNQGTAEIRKNQTGLRAIEQVGFQVVSPRWQLVGPQTGTSIESQHRDCAQICQVPRPLQRLTSCLRRVAALLKVLRSPGRISEVDAQKETDRLSVNQCLRYAEDLVEIYEAEKARRAELQEAHEHLAAEIDRRKRLEKSLRTDE